MHALNEIAIEKGITLAQIALLWALKDDVTSVLIGASKPSQIEENLKILSLNPLTKEDLIKIDKAIL